MRPLVILRPEPGASATARAAAEFGLEPIVLPLFAVEPVAWTAPDPKGFDGLLLTSANGIRHAGPGLGELASLPAYCVGEATAAEASAAGIDVASIGDGTVDLLLRNLPGGLRLLHLCGAHRRQPTAPRQSITPLTVYVSREVEPAPSLGRAEGSVVAVHSPRAAARFASLADRIGLRRSTIALAAISENAADAAGMGWEQVEAAEEPSDRALLVLAARLCNNRR
jgi:uroporphyrinogen-III synthase